MAGPAEDQHSRHADVARVLRRAPRPDRSAGMSSPPKVFDRDLLTARRNRIAARSHAHQFLLERVAEDIVDRLAVVRRTFPVVLNLGAHNGLVGGRLRALPGVETVIDMDPSPAMVGQCRGPRVVADEEALPFADGALDLVVSGLSLHFVNDLPGALVQVRQALKPDGLMLAALLGGATLAELRECLLAAEIETAGGASPRVAPFADVRDLGGLLQRAGFALPVADSDVVEVTYASALALMRDLRAMGCANAMADRSKRPMPRATLARACTIYAERFPAPGGRVRASFEIITLTGWAPHASQQRPLRPGAASVRLADALGLPRRQAGGAAPREGDGEGHGGGTGAKDGTVA